MKIEKSSVDVGIMDKEVESSAVTYQKNKAFIEYLEDIIKLTNNENVEIEEPVEAEDFFEKSSGDTEYQYSESCDHPEVTEYQWAEGSDYPDVPKDQDTDASAHPEMTVDQDV